MKRAVLLASLAVWPSLALAGGFEYPDVGTQAMGRGGAFAAKADDGTAMYYNPAGFADQDGWRVTVDVTAGSQNSTFQRTDTTGADIGPQVSNAPGLFFIPFVAVSRGFKLGFLGKLGLAVGLYAPPANPGVTYPDEQPPATTLSTQFGNCTTPPAPSTCPGAGTSSLNTAPQKYDLISENLLVIYPTLSAAWQPIPLISVGGSVQLLVANSQFRQATYDAASAETMAHTAANEQLTYDTIANVNVNGIAFNGNVGVKLHPISGLTLGASYKPSSSLTQNGTMRLDFSPYAQNKNIGVSGQGTSNTTSNGITTSGTGPVSVSNSFPAEVKTGIDYDFGLLDVEGDFDWTQWSAYKQVTITPSFATNVGPVPQLIVPRDFNDTWSVRLGGELRLPIPVIRAKIRAGVGYESSMYDSSTVQYVSVAYANFAQFWGGVGATVGVGMFDFDLTYSHVYMPTDTVTNGGLTAAENNPPANSTSFVVNNGVYNTSYDLLALGVRAHF